MPNYEPNNFGSDAWAHLFSCCLNQEVNTLRKPQERRAKIDRSMIGEPTNFKHTAHIGSEDVNQTISCEPLRLSAIESQMKSKGGYESTLTIQAY